jgi:hypothetical protein
VNKPPVAGFTSVLESPFDSDGIEKVNGADTGAAEAVEGNVNEVVFASSAFGGAEVVDPRMLFELCALEVKLPRIFGVVVVVVVPRIFGVVVVVVVPRILLLAVVPRILLVLEDVAGCCPNAGCVVFD